MKKKLAVAAVLLAALAVAGCVAMKSPDYVAPTAGPTARVTFRNLMDETVSMTLYDKAARCSRRRASPPIAASLDRTLVVAAGQPLALSSNYFSQKMRASCSVTISFDVQPQQDYLVELRPNYTGCGLHVDTLDERGRPGAPVEVRQRTWTRGWDEESDFCTP